ncbi:MAG: 50S ribosomal protein L11 methyltransferase [Pseudomonadota bacterium]
MALSHRFARPLETIALEGLPEHAVPAFEAAFLTICATVGYFREEPAETWRVEGVREQGADDTELAGALALAALMTGIDAPELMRAETEADGWLARTVTAFPEQPVGKRFLIRPTHVPNPIAYGRVVLRLDAGLAFGSGEHASTQGCLIAFERAALRRPRRILDLGSGSGILALAAAKLLHRRVLATDIEPWSVRVCAENARMNGQSQRMRASLADGWRSPRVRGPYDLVFANILARPLCAMAKHLAQNLAPGGTAILAGLLGTQARMVLAAHRRCGLRLERRINVGPWTTLVLRKEAGGK